MKRFLCLLSFVVITALAAGPLIAQTNPFIGTWKLNVAKSKFEPGPAPKSQTRTVVAKVMAQNIALKASEPMERQSHTALR